MHDCVCRQLYFEVLEMARCVGGFDARLGDRGDSSSGEWGKTSSIAQRSNLTASIVMIGIASRLGLTQHLIYITESHWIVVKLPVSPYQKLSHTASCSSMFRQETREERAAILNCR